MLKVECCDGHGPGTKRKQDRQGARSEHREQTGKNRAYQMLPSVVLVGVGTEPGPLDQRHNYSTFEQIVATKHVNKGVEGP
jgi:hypothetical protein